ncbi:hypothetical protein GDO86_002283 [Hymenochirus boettgeri]|uniref:Coiled-coil domain-containing protein 125 n=1 Tax=Hymenochirus boettgeri TaxID=247094 RepID=A0A8T2KLW9_9PIPI|nr:hypothetical protein GDO86_002283 [Hymenochirus boettgeri]
MAGGDLGEGFGRKPGGLYEGSRDMIVKTLRLKKATDSNGHYQLVKKGEEKGLSNCNVLKISGADGRRLSRFETVRYSMCRQSSIDAGSEMSNEDLKQRVLDLSEEVDLLRIELEVSQKQLSGKDEALKLLQSMAVLDKATSHTKEMLQKAELQRRTLEKEISVLEWEIEFDQVRLKNLEESWKEKYERVICENMALKDTLEIRTNEVKAAKSENTILNQQCQELVAMLDVNQQKIFHDNLMIDNSSLTDITALELAVLGACACSGGAQPCSCAKMCAVTRKQLLHLRQELETEKKSKEEAYVMADAFRNAFEQQLKRRNNVTLPLEDMEKFCKKGNKKLNHWKILGENGHPCSRDNKKGLGQRLKNMLISPSDCKNIETLDEPQEILRRLIDLLNDKEEALAHQRKVSYMLARTIEEKVDVDFTKAQQSDVKWEPDITAPQNCVDIRPDIDRCVCAGSAIDSALVDCMCSADGSRSMEDSAKTLETSFTSPQQDPAETLEPNTDNKEQPAESKRSES